MKLKYDFVINEVASNFVAVATGDDINSFNGFVKMNNIGAEIFEILKNEVTFEEIVEIMCRKYPDTAKETVIKAVTGFVDKLKEEGIIA